jgi:hypothetical protein
MTPAKASPDLYRTRRSTTRKSTVNNEKVVQFSAYQPEPKGSCPPKNGVNLGLQGECVNLAKSPVNMGLQGTPNTPPSANSGVPGDDVSSGVNLKTHVLPVKAKAKAKIKTSVSPQKTPGPDGYKLDCVEMPYGKLKTEYSREFNSWRSRKHDCKKKGGKWSPEWDSFKTFLLSKGPCPGPGLYTLRRIDNANPDYGPGLCKWALKEEQNNNKSDNVQLVEPGTGKVWTPKKIANATGATVNTVYKRIGLHWSLPELLGGKKSPPLRDLWVNLDELPPAPSPAKKKVHREDTPSPPHLAGAWLRAMLAAYPGEVYVLTAAERGMLNTFASICSQACLFEDRAVEVLEHTIKDWTGYTSRVRNDHGTDKGSLPNRPTPGFLIKYPRPAINKWLKENDLKIDSSLNVVPKKVPAPLSMMEETQIWMARDDL